MLSFYHPLPEQSISMWVRFKIGHGTGVLTEIISFAVSVGRVKIELFEGLNHGLDFAAPQLIFALIQPLLALSVGLTKGLTGQTSQVFTGVIPIDNTNGIVVTPLIQTINPLGPIAHQNRIRGLSPINSTVTLDVGTWAVSRFKSSNYPHRLDA
ncbi:MAG: hypothetical protein HS114_09390 [Anaerolineales bacterium]|nr:hypothetical protein [Anaerolineales bacterium]